MHGVWIICTFVAAGAALLGAHERIAETRVRQAGFRLAHLINKALDPSYTGPVQDSTQKP